MDLTHDDEIAAPPADVVAQLTDRGYLLDYCAALGAECDDVTVESDGDRTRTRLVATIRTAGVPGVFRKLVGDSVTVTDVRSYAADGSGCELEVRAAVGDRSAEVTGRITIGPNDAGTALQTRAVVTAHVPLVGGRVESAIVGLIEQKVLGTQRETLTRRLTT